MLHIHLHSTVQCIVSVMAKLYIGNVDKHTDKRELESEFAKFGTLREVWVARHPPGFAFVEFEDDR